MNNRLVEYLKSDRQWFRDQRIAHAKLQMDLSISDRSEWDFWRSVIQANLRDDEK